MKQLLFLLLFPCLALAQYQGNGNQKITLGEQTTADGLVFRGVANDTNIITPFSDTSAYIILDTIDSKFYHYNRTTTYWALAGGGGGSTLDTATMLLPYYRAGRNGIIQAADVPTLNQNTTGSAATLTTARNIRTNLASAYGANFDGSANITPGVMGVLGAGNGGTGASNFGSPNRIPFVSSSGSLTTDTFFAYNGTTQRLGVGVPNPTEKLHVDGNGSFTGSIFLGTPLTVANGGTGQSTLAAAGINTGSGTLNYLPKYTSTGTTLGNSLIFDNGSSVGIGTASPTYKLDVNGTGRFVDSIFLGNVIIGKTKQNNNSIRFGINLGLSTADKNVAIGTNNLQKDTGGENVAIGFEAGKSITTGTRNMLIGSQAGTNMTTAESILAIGSTALLNYTAGYESVALGRASLEQSTSGNGNTAVGQATLYRTTGDFNTAIGYRAGWANSANNNTTGSNNSFIGNEAVGASATASNVITLGNSSIATIRAQVTTITSLSDIRDKTEILPLNYGMNFIDKLKPVSFIWDMRDGGKIGIPEIGFIAQDLQQAQIESGINIPNLVSGVDEKLEASYGVLLPIIVKALQEANDKIKSLEQRIINFENK